MSRTNLPTGFAGRLRHAFLYRFNVHRRLTLCFIFIILLMLVGNGVLLRQFRLIRAQTERFNGMAEELIEVLRVHSSLTSLCDRLGVSVQSEDSARLLKESDTLRTGLLDDAQRTQAAFHHLVPELKLDPTVLPTLESIERVMLLHLEAIRVLAASRDWEAVRLRLERQVRPLEFLSSELVKEVDRKVAEQRTQAALNIARAEHRMFLVAPIAGFVTLLIAAGLGVAISRSITEPLGQLVEGSKALAQGEFRHQVAVIGEDELADLGRVFNETTWKLRDLYETLRIREETLRQSEHSLRTTIDTIPVLAWVAGADGDLEFHNQCFLAYTGLSQGQLLGQGWRTAVYPDDLPGLEDHWPAVLASIEPAEHEARLRRFDGEYRWFLFRGTPLRDNQGNSLKWYGTNTDIHDHKLAELENARLYADLSESEYRLRTTLDAIPVMAWVAKPDGDLEFHNQRWLAYTGVSEEQPLGQGWRAFVHPDDVPGLVNRRMSHLASGEPGEYEARIRRFDGEYRWFLFRGGPLRDNQGNMLKWYGTNTDIHDRKLAEDRLRRSEAYLTEAQRLSHTGSWAWDVSTKQIFWSAETFRIFGLDPSTTTPTTEIFLRRIHPDDRASLLHVERELLKGNDAEYNYRIVLPDNSIRYVRSVGHPITNASGQVVEFVGTVIDVTEQRNARSALEKAFGEIKTLKDQLYKENIVLREEIDKVYMFEEIVGNSPALQAVIARLSKVAPTDSTVLITGETGTGKELIARALHKRSLRSARAFVSVNCGAISPGLVESELFGHIKGAFTGAIANRDGRFKIADGGTIFLDEVGDLPPETQVKLLRVLQEHEFEPIGSNKTVKVDVRILAATNRNLEEDVRTGKFRCDLLYRLNVFPIHVPPLRERLEDLPLLVAFLLQTFAQKLGKNVTQMLEGTMRRLVEYSWPGNVRELQNVIERGVILSPGNLLVLDREFSLAGDEVRAATAVEVLGPIISSASCVAGASLRDAERRHIEAALAATNWIIEGEKGAAKILDIHPNTLRSRMKKLDLQRPGEPAYEGKRPS
jgi:PAS domain S-box-containing protein